LGTDPEYLREHQYKDAANLSARMALHAKYSRSREPWYPWLAGRVEWPEGADVLEVGCGTGALWTAIAPLLPRVRLTLTDLSEGMVETARRAVAGLDNVDLADVRTCDVQELPFAGAAFDVVVANHMLYHVPDRARAVTELARVLRRDGALMAATNGPQHLDAVSDLSRQVLGWSPLELTDRRFGRSGGAAVLGSSFDTVEWHGHPSTMVCTDPDDVFAFIASTAAGQLASSEQRAALRSAIEARFRAGGGMLHVRTESGCFVARDPERRPQG
jgi:SAM-dependent methyltransferase